MPQEGGQIMSLISKEIVKPQMAATIGDDGNITILGNKKEKKFSHFRSNVSADIKSVEISVNSRAIIKANGEALTEKEQLDLLASYQTAQLQRNVQRTIDSVRKFLSSGDFVVDERYVSSDVDVNSKAKDWLKSSLYHSLCGVGTSFQHNGINYHVITTTDSHTLSGMKAINFINGTSSINLLGNSGSVITPSKDVSILVDTKTLSDAMKEIITSLNIKVSDGELSIQGIVVRRWTQRESINLEASDNTLSDINLEI